MSQLEELWARRWIAAFPRKAERLRQAFADTAALPESTRQALLAEMGERDLEVLAVVAACFEADAERAGRG